MAGLPIYDPGGTQRTAAQQANNPSPDAFGGATARALVGAGNQFQNFGEHLLQLEAKAKEQDDKTAVIDGLAEASNRQRVALYGDGGLLTRTGKNAEGLPDAALETMDQIGGDIAKRFTDPKQAAAFHAAWSGQTQSTADAAARVELDQKQKYRTATKTAALASLTDDAIAAYNDEEVLSQKLNQARQTIRLNPDSLPDNMIEQMERESVSAMQVQVIQRMAQDSPGRALDYYTRHKGDVSGSDHAKVDSIISGVAKVREATQFVDEIASNGEAGRIIKTVIGAESGSNVGTADSPTGAAGLMQLQPDTAREVAQTLPGLGARIAGKSDDELSAYWRTPQGVKDNIRIGSTYLNKQLGAFNGDLEAALIAYNAGPANATKWLNEGRDYSKLPKPQETLPYVKKIFASLGYDAPGDTSADIQGATKGASYFKGDAPSFLASKLKAGQPAEYITNMKPAMQNSVAGLINDAPEFVKAGLGIFSGARSHERQAELWAAEVAKRGGDWQTARKWVAPPEGMKLPDGSIAKGSNHEHGNAVDLGWNGGKLSDAPPAVIQWVHDNASKYGLVFPLSNENWHVELKGARGSVNAGAFPRGGKASVDRLVNPAGMGGTQQFYQPSGTVVLAPTTANPADIYTKSVAPFTVAPDATNLNDWLQTARDNLSDNPSLLAEVERQLTDKSQMSTAALKAQETQLKTDLFRTIVGGGHVRDLDPSVLAASPDAVKTMLEFETAWNKESNESDPAVYYKLSMMDGKELHDLGPDIVDYAKDLSKADLKSFIDKAGQFAKTGGAATRATDQTRSQIVSSAQNILALDPSKRPDDAKTMATLNRALDVQINGYIERVGKEPDGTAMQKMMDDLLIQGHIKKDWARDPAAVAFAVPPEDRGNFYAASTISDVPPDALPVVSKAAASVWQLPPDPDGTVRVPEDMAVSFYNDLVVTKMGGAPTPPDKLYSKIADGLARKLGRVPQQAEVSAFYAKWIARAAQGN